VPPPTSARRPPGSPSSALRSSGTFSSAAEAYGSDSRIAESWAIDPSRERSRTPVTVATPGTAVRRSRTSWTSACVAGPLSRSTRIVIGWLVPAGKARSMALKPSTLSVCFLKKAVTL
jgi:hypothetical protein